MISRRRYRRMPHASDCCGLSAHARGPPRGAEVHEDHSGQFMRPMLRSRAGGGATGLSLKTLLVPTIHTKGMA